MGLIGLLGVAAHCAPAQTIDRSSEAAFRASAATMAREMAPDLDIREGDGLLLEAADPVEPHRIRLAEPWGFCGDKPRRCDDAVRRWLGQAIEAIRGSTPGPE